MLPARTASFAAVLAQLRACAPLRALADALRNAADSSPSALDAICGVVPLVYWLTSTDTTFQALPRKQLASVARAALRQVEHSTVLKRRLARALLDERDVLKAARVLLDALNDGDDEGGDTARVRGVRAQLALHRRAQQNAHTGDVVFQSVTVRLLTFIHSFFTLIIFWQFLNANSNSLLSAAGSLSPDSVSVSELPLFQAIRKSCSKWTALRCRRLGRAALAALDTHVLPSGECCVNDATRAALGALFAAQQDVPALHTLLPPRRVHIEQLTALLDDDDDRTTTTTTLPPPRTLAQRSHKAMSATTRSDAERSGGLRTSSVSNCGCAPRASVRQSEHATSARVCGKSGKRCTPTARAPSALRRA